MWEQSVTDLAAHFQEAAGIHCMVADVSGEVWNAAPICGTCKSASAHGCWRADGFARFHSEPAVSANAALRRCVCAAGFAFAAATLCMARGFTLVAGPAALFDGKGNVGLRDVCDGDGEDAGRSGVVRMTRSRFYSVSELLALCAAGFGRVREEAAPTPHADAVKKVKDYVASNYMKKFTLDDVARNAYLSRSHLSNVFKAETGRTLSAYINEARIEKSKALLGETSLPLLDIALRCGFEDQSYFSKVFKAMVGVAPKEYRAQVFRYGWPES